MAAKVNKLAKLHQMITDMFIEDIRLAQQADIPMAASDKAVIVKFLKDNNITADPDDSKMQQLDKAFREQMAQKRQARAQALLARNPETDDNFIGLFS